MSDNRNCLDCMLKTKSSARMISLPPQVIELLKEQKAWQENRLIENFGELGEYKNRVAEWAREVLIEKY